MSGLTWMSRFPEGQRLSDRYFWLTLMVITRNAIMRDYQNSFLGVVWTVILPLIQVLIFALIMPLIMRHSLPNYPLYLVVSFPLWAFISSSLVQSCHSIISQAETIKRCMMPSAVFPMTDVMKHGYNYVVSFGVMYGVCVLLHYETSWVVLMLPVVLLPIFISVMAMSLAIAYVAPYVRDLGYVVHMMVNVMFWFTPVVYPLQAVPQEYHAWFAYNPFYVLLHPVQQLVFYHQLPTSSDLAALFSVMCVAIAASFVIYRRCRRNYVYYL